MVSDLLTHSETAESGFLQKPFGIVYLEDLTCETVSSRIDLKHLVEQARASVRPFITLRYGERAGRNCWQPQETHYLSNL